MREGCKNVSKQVAEIEEYIRTEGKISEMEWPSDMKGILGVTLTEVNECRNGAARRLTCVCM